MKFLFLLLSVFSLTAFSQDKVVLTEQNTMSLNGPVNSSSMTGLMLKLKELNKIETTEPIFLVINSPGGSIYDGFDFIRFAASSKRKINTITIFAASMGFQIVEALGDRLVTSYSTLMSHKARGSMAGEFPGQLDSRYNHVLSHLAEQDKFVVSRTNGKHTVESYATLIQNEYWANSQKAISDGFADKEVVVECDKSLDGSYFQLFDLGFFSINAEFSKCPLIVSPISLSAGNGLDYIIDNKLNLNNEFQKLFELKNVKF